MPPHDPDLPTLLMAAARYRRLTDDRRRTFDVRLVTPPKPDEPPLGGLASLPPLPDMHATDPSNLFRQAAPFALVGAAHLVLLWLATTALARTPTPVIPPSVVGQLVSQAPVTEPQPLPMQPEPPRPKPVVRPRPTPVPPLPQAPPSERAVTAPPAEPEPPANDAPAPAEPLQPVPAAAPAPAPSPKAEPVPVAPPRSDASHLNNPAPVYPAQSRRLREEGRVLFDVYILPNGNVGEIRLKRSSGYPRLDEAALEAVRRWRYVPAKRGDEPIPYWYVQPIDFEFTS